MQFCGVQKILFPIDDICFVSIEKSVIPCSYIASFFPPNILYTH